MPGIPGRLSTATSVITRLHHRGGTSPQYWENSGFSYKQKAGLCTNFESALTVSDRGNCARRNTGRFLKTEAPLGIVPP